MHPKLFDFTLFGHTFTIHTYGAAMAGSFMLAMLLATRRAKKEGIDPDRVIDVSFWVLVLSILGARALYFMTQPRSFSGFADIFKLWQGGLVWYGGMIGGAIAVAGYAYLKKEPAWRLMDLVSPYVALGYGFHRAFGCFNAGCCHGKPTEVPWGVAFPPGSPAANVYGAGTPVHPTQIYQALLGWGIFLLLVWYRKRKRTQGEVTILLFAAYAAGRSFIEHFRGDKIRGTHVLGLPFSTSQFISLFVGLAALLLFFYLRSRKSGPLEPAKA